MNVSKWTDAHSEEADYQGWNLFAIDGNQSKLEIQKVDELEVFESDSDALEFVRAWANATDSDIDPFAIETCKLALELSGQ
jgi:hypothetical protein